LVPVDHVGHARAPTLPGIVVVRLPSGANHFAVAWRRVGAFVQVMDPASGRHWLRLGDAAGLTQFGVSLHDTIKTMPFPVIEVHISNRHAREHWRGHSIISPAVKGTVEGLGWRSYTAALRTLVEIVREPNKQS